MIYKAICNAIQKYNLEACINSFCDFGILFLFDFFHQYNQRKLPRNHSFLERQFIKLKSRTTRATLFGDLLVCPQRLSVWHGTFSVTILSITC